MLELCYIGDYNRIVDSGLEGQQFRNEIRVGFFIEPPLKSSPEERKQCYLYSKERQYTYANQLTNLETTIL